MGITADRDKDIPADQDSEAQTSVAVEPSLVAHFTGSVSVLYRRGLGPGG